MERKNILVSNYPYPKNFSVLGVFRNLDGILVDKASGIEVGFNSNITSFLDFETLSHIDWYVKQSVKFQIINNRGLCGLSKDSKFFLDFGSFPDVFWDRLHNAGIDIMLWNIGDTVELPALILLETLGYYDDDLILEHLY